MLLLVFLVTLFVAGCDAFLAPSSATKAFRGAAGYTRQLTMSSAAPLAAHKILPGLGPVVEQFEAFLIDQWGVMHDGTRAYPGAVEAIARLALLGKSMVLLSNSSKRKEAAFANLSRMGFRTDAILDVVTSGELAWQGLSLRTEEPFKSLGQRCFILGNGDDDVEYATSAGCILSAVESADFILARGVFATVGGSGVLRNTAAAAAQAEAAGGAEQGSVVRYLPNLIGNEQVEAGLAAAAARGVPMLVSNPDFMRPGTNDPMPGMLGRYYAALGGKVHYVGKPYPLVYERSLEILAPHVDISDKSRICAVGDSLSHDILGAIDAGLPSIFVTGGVHHNELGVPQGAGVSPQEDALAGVYAQHLTRDNAPTYAVPAFRW